MLDCFPMSEIETQQVEEQSPSAGVLLGSVTAPRWGERATLIRKIATRYPELSQAAIARRVGCSEGNVSQVLKSYLKDTDLASIDEFRNDKAAILETFQHRTLSSITDADIANSSFTSRITAFAIMEDKIRLMRGQPTSIHVHALVDVLDAIAEKREREGK